MPSFASSARPPRRDRRRRSPPVVTRMMSASLGPWGIWLAASRRTFRDRRHLPRGLIRLSRCESRARVLDTSLRDHFDIRTVCAPAVAIGDDPQRDRRVARGRRLAHHVARSPDLGYARFRAGPTSSRTRSRIRPAAFVKAKRWRLRRRGRGYRQQRKLLRRIWSRQTGFSSISSSMHRRSVALNAAPDE